MGADVGRQTTGPNGITLALAGSGARFEEA